MAARNDVAWSLTRLGRDLDRALGLVESAIGQLGALPELLDTLATLRLRRGEWEQALELAERASGEAQGDLRAHLLYLRAEALAQGGRKQPARDALKQALAAAGQVPPFWHDAALALGRALKDGDDETIPSAEASR